MKREVSLEAMLADLVDASEVEPMELAVEKEFAGESWVMGWGRASAFWCGCGWGGLAGRVGIERGTAAARKGKRRVRSLMVKCSSVGRVL